MLWPKSVDSLKSEWLTSVYSAFKYAYICDTTNGLAVLFWIGYPVYKLLYHLY